MYRTIRKSPSTDCGAILFSRNSSESSGVSSNPAQNASPAARVRSASIAGSIAFSSTITPSEAVSFSRRAIICRTWSFSAAYWSSGKASPACRLREAFRSRSSAKSNWLPEDAIASATPWGMTVRTFGTARSVFLTLEKSSIGRRSGSPIMPPYSASSSLDSEL